MKSPRAHSQRQENRRKPAAPPVEFPKTQNVESDIDDIEEKEGWWVTFQPAAAMKADKAYANRKFFYSFRFSGDDESFSTKSDTLSDDEDLDLGSGSGDEPDMNLSGHPGFHPLQGVTRRPTTPDGLTEPWDVSMPPGNYQIKVIKSRF